MEEVDFVTRLLRAIVTVIVVAMYLTPSLIAVERNPHSSRKIFLLNLFLGWTIVGWVIALMQALRR
jgi:hypothetical protein